MYKYSLVDLVTVHKIVEEVNILCSHSMADTAAAEDAEMIQIKRRYQDVTRSYMRK